MTRLAAVMVTIIALAAIAVALVPVGTEDTLTIVAQTVVGAS